MEEERKCVQHLKPLHRIEERLKQKRAEREEQEKKVPVNGLWSPVTIVSVVWSMCLQDKTQKERLRRKTGKELTEIKQQ